MQLRNRSVGVVGNLEITVSDPGATGALRTTGMDAGRGCAEHEVCALTSDCIPPAQCLFGRCSR